MFFDLQLSICDRFQCLSPFDIRRERFEEVILLVERLNNYSSKKQVKKNNKIRRPAGDNWF